MREHVKPTPRFTLDIERERRHDALVHPSAHDLEIQEFGSYDLVIDARSPREYALDHVPIAINLPVVDSEQYARVGILHKHDKHQAYMRGVADSLRNMADALDYRLAHLPANARILVYCFRGGKRSRLWAQNLSLIGYRVDLLAGGWKRYRQWVLSSLSSLPTRFRYAVLSGPTGTGKTRLLHALDAAGAQVLDLEGLAGHRGSLIGAIPGVEQPSQKFFDSLLLERMRRFDATRPVWIEAESRKIGAIQLPEALFHALNQSTECYELSAPMKERVRLWSEDFNHFVAAPTDMTDRLRHLVPLIGQEEFSRWEALAREGQAHLLFERVMLTHYDPTYQRASRRNRPEVRTHPIVLDDLKAETLGSFASRLVEHETPDSSGGT